MTYFFVVKLLDGTGCSTLKTKMACMSMAVCLYNTNENYVLCDKTKDVTQERKNCRTLRTMDKPSLLNQRDHSMLSVVAKYTTLNLTTDIKIEIRECT